jgi:putative protease
MAAPEASRHVVEVERPIRRRPEILAPAGDRDALAAALAAGADAVYFGLDDGFNARARARNFPSDGLAEVVAQVHRAGARAYVTLNTLVFEPELPVVEELIRRIAAAGVDAIIVQDPAVAQIARALCRGPTSPGLELHASTQITASSPAAAELLADLGFSRVVVPRELSIEDIAAYRAGTKLDLEVFVHGALCVAWSGQCLSSEAWGGRSANRGQCAQACRLPYGLIVDGMARELGDVAYLLSPRDLTGLDHVQALAELGVASLKIEGRLKGPGYVATAVAQYRREVDPDFQPASEIPLDREALQIAYSRGVSAGFLAGVDHQALVEGTYPRHRGILLGTVTEVAGDEVEVSEHRVSVREVRAGMGVVFDHGHPEDPEQGGPIFFVAKSPGGHRLKFGEPGPDLRNVHVGDRVWINSDPRITRAGERATVAGHLPLGRIPLDLVVRGREGEPLEVRAGEVMARSRSPLAPARAGGLTHELLVDKLGGLGGTAFHLHKLEHAALEPGLHIPVSELKELRRTLVTELDAQLTKPREVRTGSVLDQLRPITAPSVQPTAPLLVPLCRDDAQLDAVLDAGVREVELDWMELVGLGRAVARARSRGARVVVATVRVQKPGEDKIDAHLARLEPDAVLVRSWGSLAALRGVGPVLHGDFSLNVTNSIAAGWVLAQGLQTITAAHDLDREQLFALLEAAPRGSVAVTIHHHIPTFHTEHCVYAHLLSGGRDHRTCGRPCEIHRIALRDRVGLVHPVIVDVGCRNTVFNAQAQSAAALVPEMMLRGVHRFRLELVRETAEETGRLFTAYADLVAGKLTPPEVVGVARVHEQFGVTRGTMRTLSVLR